MKNVIVFDLDDTLAESKTDITEEMSKLFHGLLCEGIYSEPDESGNKEFEGFKYKVGIISGCAYEQFHKQVLEPMWKYVEKNDAWGRDIWAEDALSQLYLMPASGSQLYYYSKGWQCAYKESLNLREKVEIYNLFHEACDKTGILPSSNPYGEIAEDRDSQITFSFFGQRAPLGVKKPWDPDQQKRLVVANAMKELSKEGKYEMTVGGASSIDVTLRGRDKAYGMNKFMEFDYQPFKHKINKERVLFVADALFAGGNDYSVISTGVECVPTKHPEETMKIIESLLGENNAVV